MAALVPVGGSGDMQGCLLQLHGALRDPDPGSAALRGFNLVRSVGEACVTRTGDSAQALQSSLVFSKDQGLLVFIRKSLSIEEFRDCREEALKFLCTFLEKIGQGVHPYACDIKQTCISVYTKDKMAKCKIPALELLVKLLQNVQCSSLMGELKVGEIFNKFYGELAGKSRVPDTVLEKIYELLGVLGEVQPSDMLDNSEKLFRAYLGELKTQMTSATREPKLPVVAGCLKGLTALLYNFTKSMEEDPRTSKEIFDFAVKAINPQVDLKRYAVPLAGLRMFGLHAAQFGTCLLDNYVMLFEVMSKWCGHTNVDLKKAGHSALDSVLKQISLMVAKDAEMHKSKLKFFMEQFYSIIRKMDSSNKELSIAIRGYGLFAAPCKAINSKDVDIMYIELLQRCKQMYLTEAETADDNVYQLPSFLQSIASVIFHLDTLPEVYTPVLEHLIVMQIDSFPRYSEKMQPVCCRSIVKVFLALAGKGPVLWNFISTVVHQGLIRVCSKPIVFSREFDGKGASKSEEPPAVGEVRTGKWKVPTYRDYLDLFRSLLNCDAMKESVFADENFLTINSPLQSLNRLLYDELIKSILKIIEKLDLTVQKMTFSEQAESESGDVMIIPSSDPASNLQPAKPTDFIAFINLVEFCREILPKKHLEYFKQWVYSFGYELIIQSTRLPLISGFYKLLSVVMKIVKKIKYFEDVSPGTQKKYPEDPEKSSCFALFAKFGKEVAARMKQYKDELLASCLTFVLSLPHDIIMLDIKAYVPALQNAFKLGLSYTPMADVALSALEDWSSYIPKNIMQPYYKDVLPLLDGYLKTATSPDEFQNNWEVKKLSQAVQKGFNKVVIQRLRKAKALSLNEDLSLEAMRSRVVQLLGSLGGQVNRNLVTAASEEEMMKKFVSWDSEKHLNFAVPFVDMKPVIYLDIFLPRVTELALSASDRQTKVAACELLHGLVMFMLGKASQMPERRQGSSPMYQLYKRTFPVLLCLACDVDQVARQLYEPLVMQLIHWFTNNKKFESQDTVALLEAILDGIVDPVDSTLRDFCGQCIREFMKWSIKQTTPQQQEKSPVNTKSLFKRLYSLALHPNAFKRLGAALAFNNIYREFREENSLVEQFAFEALIVFIESLALTHTDEKSLGTTQQCCDAIDHLKRIIKHKAPSLNKAEKRRLPRGFQPAESLCLLDIVTWLMMQCGRPQTECRHKSMELFYEFVPLLPGNKSPSSWLGDVLKKQDSSFLINKFEGGGNQDDNLSGILSYPTLHHLQEPFSVRAVVQWMDMLLAALDCYNTFIEQRMFKPENVLGTNSSFLRAVEFFLETIALHDIHAAEQCFYTKSKDNVFSPQEREEYNYSKCTIVVRIIRFVSMILEICQQDFWKLLEKELLNLNLIELLVVTVCDPSAVGFNTADVQVMKNLPDNTVRLMKALAKSPYKSSLELSIKKRITSHSIQELCSVDLYDPDAHFDRVRISSILSACKQLHKAGVLHSVLQSQGSGLHFTVGSQLLSVVYKGIAPGDERKCLPSLDISSKRLADGLLQLAFAFGCQSEELVSLMLSTAMLFVPLSEAAPRNLLSFCHGEYFYNLFSETINHELLKNLDVAILQLMKSAVDNPRMVGTILNGMLDQSFRERTVRKQQGMKLVTAVLRNWMRLDTWWAKDSAPESKMAVLTLLAKVLQVDSSVSFNTKHEAFFAVFNTYTSLLVDQNLGLNLKSQAVIILPFFTNLTGERLKELKDALDQLVAFNFPMKSDEFPKGTLRYNNYVDCTKKFLDALELSQSPLLLQLMTEILCWDHRHCMEDLFQTSFRRVIKRSDCNKQVVLLDTVYKMFQSESLLSNVTRQAFLDRSLLTLLLYCSLDALKEFFSKIVVEAMDTLKSRFTKSNETVFYTQVIKKTGYYKILEVLYSCLSKEDVHSKDSQINQAYQGTTNVEGNELTKMLIKSCYDAFTENMAGESHLLGKRREYHCAAYNCAIAVISCVFTESKFYQGFLFTEKPEKNLLIFENLIDLKHQYSFPVEIEVPMERKKRYIAIRKEARDTVNGGPDEPQYLPSASYMVDSSLSEEMSQFDFSTGVQSFSYNTQDPTATSARFRRKESTESMVLDDEMELEMDELNQHECMTAMTTLIKHMQRNQITPQVDEGAVSVALPPWMKFLHSKLGNPSVPLNIRLFLAKLIVNTEEVFRPYARHWLGPLLQLVVSRDNGGEGIHYMVVEIVVTLLSWTSVASPKGNVKDEILANRLLEFLMKNAFHQKRAVFRHNLEIIKTVVECWKDCLTVPYRLIFEQFSGGDPDTKDNSVGIQLLGIVLANNLPPYDPKCEIDSTRYFEALVNNMASLKYKEVYAAAAEVLGLTLRYIAEKENITEGPIYDCVVKQLKQHQNTKEDKFILCLNKVVKNFPPVADRFINAVFFLLPKLHGVLKTSCLEVVMCRAEEITDLYLQLRSKDFMQVMNRRDDERQRVCLDIIYKMLSKLKPLELRELLPGVIGFISHPSPVCRERMYDIMMWIYDNYRNSESQADEDSQEVFKVAKEMLIQGLTDEISELQLVVRNFWSDETRLPTNTLDRMLALLNSFYSTKTETQYLSLATNFLLEMTSKSPDYSRKIFEHPLSECRFQDFIIDSNWRYRSTILTPMFVETQASQSASRKRSQEGSLSTPGSQGAQVRATQQQYEFTPTQNVSGRKSFNWLTGSSIDTLTEYTVPSSSESLSSSMLFVNKRSEKSQRGTLKPVGPNFGKKKLGLPGDEVDSTTKDINERAEILRLRRRFLKDQEKLSVIYARKGVAEQKREKEIKTELTMKRDAQVTLYRSYRQGDLPDIQIEYSSLITPLQGVAQRDPTLAKQLFSSLFTGILKEMENSKSPLEKNHIVQKLLQNFNDFLSISVSYFPPFISCIQEMSYQHKELLDIDSASVSTSCLASLQQPVGILLLEQALIHLSPIEEPPAKRMCGRTELSPDVIRWIELAKLYRSVGDYDVLRGIFSGRIGTKEITQKALLAEAKSDYVEAVKQYDEALSKQDWSDGEPSEAERDFWELASLECYDHLTEWKSLEYCCTLNIDSEQPPDLNKTWSDPFFQETYLPYIIRSKLKLLLHGGSDQSLLTFIDEAMKMEQRKALIEMHYSQELSLLYILQDDFDRARYYISNGMQVFMQNYSSIDALLHQSRLTKLQSVQALTEIQDFINFMRKPSNLASQASLKRLLRIWTSRYPDAKMDPMNIWDDIITNRCFFLDKIQEKLLNVQADDSMEVVEAGDIGDEMEVDQQEDNIHSMIRSCKFNMKMKMIESARKQNSFAVAKKLLKDLQRESKTRDSWLVRWNHSYCRVSHSSCQSQSSPQQILTVLKTVSLLDENVPDQLSKNIEILRNQNLLLGITYRIMAVALSKDPWCLEELEEDKVRKVSMLSGEKPDSPEKVIASLNKQAFQYFSNAVRKAEEEMQSRTMEHVNLTGVIDAYLTLVDFCDKHLHKEEEGLSDISAVDLQTFPAIVVEKMIKALKLNSREARLKFPRLLQIIERYPAETLSLMAQEISTVPCWQFIGWISQMMAVLDKDEAVAVHHTVEEIADNYPQAIIFPFMISSENYSFKDTATGHKNKEFVTRIKSKLDRGGVIQDFVQALEQLSNPEMLFKDWVDAVRNELGKAQKNKAKLKEMYEGMYGNLGNLQASGLGLFRRRFIQAYGKEFDTQFGKGGSKLLDMKDNEFIKIVNALLAKMRDGQKEPGNLKEYSPWLSEFKAEFWRNELEIPGQYDGKGKPLPEYHAKISGFDERIKVMESLRKPKRIIIRGSDEREYPFLVKGGEDLRQDQRIEQLFDVMNIILSQDASCSQRNMQIKTYQVIPMTTRLGLIEWLPNTCTLKNFLHSNMSEEEKADYCSEKGPLFAYNEWLSKMAGGKIEDFARYMPMYKRASRTETVMSFRNRENRVPKDLLRRAFVKMSTAPEAFLSLRSHFTSSHALICISHWILGIGDRHLSNFMINTETGGIIGIDFGYAFGSATQMLPVPELMPFRLTHQFINLMLPMKESGLIYSIMRHALRAYRKDPDLLINTMDVFVKEPSLDWKNFELRLLKKGGTWLKEVNTCEVNWYPLQKVNCVKRKLAGSNPAAITCEELRLGHEKSLAYRDYVAVARGTRDQNIRAKEPEDGLTEETQVKCLIDQATDPNILGRVWAGWESWM
ncbi:DNA-dependent protein kinase catalytic subunit isoform B [Alligator mississippiensis]|uniref:DNA-dependent protein kinase catalytic subunit n=1 Tax=Alligator mississippiensis TaxID=8496 RepID=A0A151MNN4_ALLMI|nr:DNA-dependent protein kinase catalytic subunit isoform B [Alligator mississippiensis]